MGGEKPLAQVEVCLGTEAICPLFPSACPTAETDVSPINGPAHIHTAHTEHRDPARLAIGVVWGSCAHII